MWFSPAVAFSRPREPHKALRLPSGRALPFPENPTPDRSCDRACCNEERVKHLTQKPSYLAIPLPLRYMLEYMPAEPDGCEKGVE